MIRLRLPRWLALRLLWAFGVRTWPDARAVAGPLETRPATDGLESFERAFDPRVCGCRVECRCGRVFWDTYNSGYDWYEGEIEALEKNPSNSTYPHEYGTPVAFEERHTRPTATVGGRGRSVIKAFIDGHAREIAEYLSLEKRRLADSAERAPEVRS